MTPEQFKKRLKKSLFENYLRTQKTLPYGKRKFIDEKGFEHPGNLAYRSFQLIERGDSKFDLKIDLNIAPYAAYIDRPGFRTFGYWDKAVEEFIQQVAKDLGGTLTKK